MRTTTGRLLAALTLTAALAGCGGETTPADAAPELARQLTRVDQAVAAGNEDRIRARVESLVAATESARESGRIDDVQADRILAAADALLARLPAEEPAPEPPSPPTSSPTTETPEPPEEAEDDEDDEDDDDNSGPGSGDEKEKPDKGEKGKGKGNKDD